MSDENVLDIMTEMKLYIDEAAGIPKHVIAAIRKDHPRKLIVGNPISMALTNWAEYWKEAVIPIENDPEDSDRIEETEMMEFIFYRCIPGILLIRTPYWPYFLKFWRVPRVWFPGLYCWGIREEDEVETIEAIVNTQEFTGVETSVMSFDVVWPDKPGWVDMKQWVYGSPTEKELVTELVEAMPGC